MSLLEDPTQGTDRPAKENELEEFDEPIDAEDAEEEANASSN